MENNIIQKSKNFYENRFLVAQKYLKGEGIEIGALHTPLKKPDGVNVKYVDRFKKENLVFHYAELNKEEIVETDIVDDCERLLTFKNDSQDFIIANHVLEHCEDPILAMQNFLRIIKKGGFIFLCLPIKKYNIDSHRKTTSYFHFLTDHFITPKLFRPFHYFAWVFLAEKHDLIKAIKRTGELLKINYSIHFHVWSEESFLDFLKKINKKSVFDIEHFERYEGEVVCVLKKK